MTRYPKRGKNYRWTVKEMEAIPVDWQGDTLADGDGLQGEVRLTGEGLLVSWRYAFKWEGKVKRFYCGSWPAVTLESIRAARDDARATIKRGVNPCDQKKAEEIEAQRAVLAILAEAERERAGNLLVRDLALTWLANGVRRKDENAEVKRILHKDVLPIIGDIPLRNLKEDDLLGVRRRIVKRDANRLAVMVDGLIRQMLSWAERRQPWRGLLIEGNPADLVQVENVVDPDYDLNNVRDRVLSDDELRELRDIFARMQYGFENAPDRRKATRPVVLTTQIALWVCLGALTRIGETVKARWEHVDFAERTWFIPKENVKRVRGGSRDHVVHLSDFLFDLFKLLKRRTGHTPYCFPSRLAGDEPELISHLSPSAVSKQVGDRQVCFKDRIALKNRRNDDSLVLAEGRNGNWTPHDLRRTGATIMETLGVEDKIIDLCQNHAIHTGAHKVRRHYLHADNGPRMRRAWDMVSEHLVRVIGRPDTLVTLLGQRNVSLSQLLDAA